MRKLVELGILLVLCTYIYSTGQPVVTGMWAILFLTSLSLLTGFMPTKAFHWISPLVLILSGIFSPVTLFFSPLLSYSLYQRDPRLSLIPLASGFFCQSIEITFIHGLALWLSHQEQFSRRRRGEYFRLQNDYKEKEYLQRLVAKEQNINYEKNLEIAILMERNRISRELHDSIGHTLSAALLQMEALKIMAPKDLRPRIEQIRNALSQGMTEIRASLHNLHNTSFSLENEIQKLMKPLSSRFQVNLDSQILEPPLEVKRFILTMVRECLTNVTKHSDGEVVDIILRDLPKNYTVTIKDNGHEKERGKGIGLLNMEESARSLGGFLSYGYSGGFFVHLNLPKEEEE